MTRFSSLLTRPAGLYDKCRDILPRAFDQATQFGEVREELYDEFDIPVDRDIYGVAKPKYLSPQQLCHKRAVCLTNKALLDAKDAVVDQAIAKQDAKLAKDLDKYFELRDWHDKTVGILHKEFHAELLLRSS